MDKVEALRVLTREIECQIYSTHTTEEDTDENTSNKVVNYKPGDKFILELGEERKMFGEFEIAGTDLYVKTDLLEKLMRYDDET